jgi:hypothetical protein
MSLSSSMANGLDACGACAGTAPQTPASVNNRAGLSAISRRVGTQPLFKQNMQARLGALPALRTRASDDFTIGLLDAWACTAGVLTFYQERIANESYLRTATERRSLSLLAELVGYVPQPGVAAGTWLSFTLTAASGAAPIDVPAGTRVQSMPLPGGLPQTFETTNTVPTRVEWNSFRPSLSKPQPVRADAPGLLLSGTATGLKPGDGVVIIPSEPGSRPMLRTVAGVTPKVASQQTWVSLRPLPGETPPPHPIERAPGFAPLSFLEPQTMPTDWSLLARRATILGSPFIVRADDLDAFGWRFSLPPPQLFASLAAWNPPSAASVLALRAKASLFAANAPDPRSLADTVAAHYEEERKDKVGDWIPASDRHKPALDTIYPRIAASQTGSPSFAALKWSNTDGEHWLLANIDSTADVGIAKCTLSGKVTQLQLTPLNQSDDSALAIDFKDFNEYRSASLLADAEALTLARLPRNDEPLPAASAIDLDTWVDGLYAGQHLVVTGELDQSRGTYASEVVQILAVEQVIAAGGYTRLTLASALTRAYVRDTVTINGNVAAATHGSAVQEVLGSGNSTVPSQRFALRQSPLTHVSAATASGASSSLSVRVNGVRWSQVPNFYGSKPDDRVYTTRLGDDGSTTVVFGDGVNGARPPSGTENIVASYRQGIGAIGNVGAGQLSLLQTRPLGVQSVANPLQATGGCDAESAEDIRTNASLTLRTLERIVSLQDYEDFARAFGGIAKSLATWAWHGPSRGVFLTVAGVGGADVAAGQSLHTHLLAAIADAAEPNVPVRVISYRRASFTFGATLMVDPVWEMNAVLAHAQQRARTAFSFDRRRFGQAVTRSEIVALLQAVPGVIAVQVDALRRTDTALFSGSTPTDTALRENSQIDAALPRIGADDTMLAAELLTLDPRPLALVGVWAEAQP